MSISSLPPILWLCLTLLLPRASIQPYSQCDAVQLDSASEIVLVFSSMDRVYPELPNSLVFDEIKEVESPEDDDLPTEFIRFEPNFWNESMLLARRSSYLGHTLSAPDSPTMACDRLRC